jgi:hypothetical protein
MPPLLEVTSVSYKDKPDDAPYMVRALALPANPMTASIRESAIAMTGSLDFNCCI